MGVETIIDKKGNSVEVDKYTVNILYNISFISLVERNDLSVYYILYSDKSWEDLILEIDEIKKGKYTEA